MNQILFYGGLALAVICFLLTVFLFFFQKIPSVIRYFRNVNSKKVFKTSYSYKVPKQKPVKINNINKKQIVDKQNIYDQRTEILDVAQNYATALLDADSTELLPELNDDN